MERIAAADEAGHDQRGEDGEGQQRDGEAQPFPRLEQRQAAAPQPRRCGGRQKREHEEGNRYGYGAAEKIVTGRQKQHMAAVGCVGEGGGREQGKGGKG